MRLTSQQAHSRSADAQRAKASFKIALGYGLRKIHRSRRKCELLGRVRISVNLDFSLDSVIDVPWLKLARSQHDGATAKALIEVLGRVKGHSFARSTKDSKRLNGNASATALRLLISVVLIVPPSPTPSLRPRSLHSPRMIVVGS
jgi:hypothetical protein